MTQVGELIQVVREVSPVVWEAAIRQQYIYGIIIMFFGGVAGFFSIVCWIDHEKDDTTIGAAVLGFIALIFFVLGVMPLINPEYWALMALKP